MLTVFTAPKPFEGHIDVIQRNAIGSWLALGPEVEVLLIGDELGLARAAAEYGVRHLAEVDRNAHGTPLVSSVFELARREARHPWLCYLNADILLLDDFLPGVEMIAEKFARFLIVGRRWDLTVEGRIGFEDGWIPEMRAELARRGRPHPPSGSDFFVFPRDMFLDMPAFALGRAGWDNWMIYAGRVARVPVVDATQAVTLVHQDHDYGHLPGGRPHYRLPESFENLRLAGGRHTIFTLRDATWRVSERGVVRRGPFVGGLARRIESALIARAGFGWRGKWVWRALHPGKALQSLGREARLRLRGP